MMYSIDDYLKVSYHWCLLHGIVAIVIVRKKSKLGSYPSIFNDGMTWEGEIYSKTLVKIPGNSCDVGWLWIPNLSERIIPGLGEMVMKQLLNVNPRSDKDWMWRDAGGNPK